MSKANRENLKPGNKRDPGLDQEDDLVREKGSADIEQQRRKGGGQHPLGGKK